MGRGRFSRAGAEPVEARAGDLYRLRSSADPRNGLSAPSFFALPFAAAAPSLAPANARDRLGSSLPRTGRAPQMQIVQPALDSAAGVAAPGPCGRVEGAIAPRASGESPEAHGLNPVRQGVGPWVVRLRNHNAYPTSARPACRDGGNMRHPATPITENSNRVFSS